MDTRSLDYSPVEALNECPYPGALLGLGFSVQSWGSRVQGSWPSNEVSNRQEYGR